MMATLPLSADIVSTSPSLPPANGAYVANIDACYLLLPAVVTACLQNGSVGDFLSPMSTFPSSNQITTFGATLTADLTVGGNSMGPVKFPGTVVVEIFGRGSDTQTGSFNTQMLNFDLSGNIFGNPVLLRQDPTMPSTGMTDVSPIPAAGPLYNIHSFFDVFTDLSIDGGQTWTPVTNGPTSVTLTPEPGMWFALSVSLSGLAALRFRRR